MNFLIVDDSAIFRQLLRSNLEESGSVTIVGEAENALEAIDGIARLKPDVVILDLRLRAGNGVDILHAMKRNLSASPIAIVLTNFPYNQYKQACMNLGADYFFHKSTEFQAFMDVVRGLLPLPQAESATG